MDGGLQRSRRQGFPHRLPFAVEPPGNLRRATPLDLRPVLTVEVVN